MAYPLVTRENATQSTVCADQVSDQFIDCLPADGIAAAPETSARPAGGFQKNYTDLLRAR
jgi:hypothetical protein